LARTEVLGFLPYWEIGKASTFVDLGTLTTIAYFGVEAGKDGRLVEANARGVAPPGWKGLTSAAFDDVLRSAHAAKVRVVLTIQRFSWTAGQARKTEALLASPAARTALASAILAEIRARGIDGVNLDFEPVPSGLRDEFVAFVRELRATLDAARHGYQLTVDVGASLAGYDLAALTADDAADAAVLMAYDFRGTGSSFTGSTAPLDRADGASIRSTVGASVALADPARLIVALPWFGKAWSTVAADAHAAVQTDPRYGDGATVNYATAIDQARRSGRQLDVAEASAWTAYQSVPCVTCLMTWRQIWYDDVDAFAAKVSFARASALRGVGIWALGFDGRDHELWSALRIALGTQTDTRPPQGSASIDPVAIAGRHGALPDVVARGGLVTIRTSADDGPNGSGMAFVRLSNTPGVVSGELAAGRTYPDTTSVEWSLLDPTVGGTADLRERTVWVQWRDVAGNWSAPRRVRLWVRSIPPAPVASPAPSAAAPSAPSPSAPLDTSPAP